ncbi:Leucine-rich repeat 2 [Arabidopsis thaliana x Arabidopsis arenosa]|uniref:Leucine-rich repeat 2 n=1 Tax=Arabidopsis thaliana x Arabidopsis arenosa TaxID=1240361 RepID=A0A8T1ZMS1_9BRAS|nr:Leucine-rich repeat 2 [Arabidopsis thaliana x Arabidopsis arenosa]
MDRISYLSDDLLLKIFSSLPTKDVVVTMLLSKRWKFLWTMVPKLRFDDEFELDPSYYERFLKYVDKSMVLNRAQVLETVKFDVGPCCSSEDIATWIRIGMARNVRELEISHCEGYFREHRSIKLPKSLYSYEKLEVLKLASTVVLNVPIAVCFPSLKSLHLVCVEYKTKKSHRRLLSGCPVLEELVLGISYNNSNHVHMRSFYVEIPTLQRLSILDASGQLYDDFTFVVNAPSLKYFNFVDFYGDLCLRNNMPEVVEANVQVIYEDPKKLLGPLKSVKRLSLCLSASTLHNHMEFYQLVHLELCGDALMWWDILTWMLESSPKLQVLKLYKCECEEHGYSEDPIEDHWEEPSSVPECLLFHLNIFEWRYYNAGDEEKKVVAYILKNARQLKTAAFSAPYLYQKEELNELVYMARASSSCQLLLD